MQKSKCPDTLDQKNSDISNEEQMGSSNDQFDNYNNEIYDGLKLYAASKESESSDSEDMPQNPAEEDEIKKLYKTEEDLNELGNATDPVSKLLKIVAAGNAEDMRCRLEEFGPIQFLENHFYEKE